MPYRRKYTREKRVASFAIAIARGMGRPREEIRQIARAAFIHAFRNSDQIPVGAEIVTVAASFESLIADLHDRRPMSISKARVAIQRGSETAFDPEVIKAFLEIPADVWTELIKQSDEWQF